MGQVNWRQRSQEARGHSPGCLEDKVPSWAKLPPGAAAWAHSELQWGSPDYTPCRASRTPRSPYNLIGAHLTVPWESGSSPSSGEARTSLHLASGGLHNSYRRKLSGREHMGDLYAPNRSGMCLCCPLSTGPTQP